MMQAQMPKFAPDPIVTAVCLYIYTSLAYGRVLEKCFWVPGKVLEIFVTNRVGTLNIFYLFTFNVNRQTHKHSIANKTISD